MRVNYILLVIGMVLWSIKERQAMVLRTKVKSEPNTNPEYIIATTILPPISKDLSQVVKRCASPTDVQSTNPAEPTLSMARRDVTSLRLQQCEACKNRKLCKEKKICGHCKPYCDAIPTKETEDTPTMTNKETRALTEQPLNTENEPIILASRFLSDDPELTIPKYYSLAAVETGPIMNLLAKLFNIPEKFSKFILLGKMNDDQDEQDLKNIVIIDLAQVFGNNQKTKAIVHQFGEEKPDISVDDLNKKLDDALQKKMTELGKKTLDMDEIHKIIDDVIKEEKETNTVGIPAEITTEQEPETQTRCKEDKKEEEELFHMVIPPPHHPSYPKPKEHAKEKLIIEPIAESKESDENEDQEFGNPAVIQDNFERQSPEVGKAPPADKTKSDIVEGIVDESLTNDKANNPKPKIEVESLTNDKTIEPKQKIDVPIKKPEILQVEKQSKPELTADSQTTEPSKKLRNDEVLGNPQPETETLSQDLAKNILRAIDDGIKATSTLEGLANAETALLKNEAKLENAMVTKPATFAQANDQNVIKTYKLPEVTQKEIQLPATNNMAPDLLAESTNIEKNVGAPEPANLASRGQFVEDTPAEKSNYFGALVPVNDLPNGIADPRVKKLFYVGDNINLPLKMYQDKNGIMKLKVDTDVLCNCKNETCPNKHAEEKFREATSANGEGPHGGIPDLKVRFGKEDDLLDSLVDSLHQNNEASNIFKRSIAKDNDEENVDPIEKMQIENEIMKLNEHIDELNEVNTELFNEGTLALFKDVKKSKKVDQVLKMAIEFVNWMKDEAIKHNYS